MPNKVHQISGVFAVVDCKSGVETDPVGIFAQQPRTDAVEGAGPGEGVGHDAGLVAHDLARDALNPAGHLARRTPGEGHEQDAPRIGAIHDQMRHAVRERVGFPGTGASDHQERWCIGRAHTMFNGAALLRIKRVEICGIRQRHRLFPHERTTASHPNRDDISLPEFCNDKFEVPRIDRRVLETAQIIGYIAELLYQCGVRELAGRKIAATAERERSRVPLFT